MYMITRIPCQSSSCCQGKCFIKFNATKNSIYVRQNLILLVIRPSKTSTQQVYLHQSMFIYPIIKSITSSMVHSTISFIILKPHKDKMAPNNSCLRSSYQQIVQFFNEVLFILILRSTINSCDPTS
jgi:hypothetical protein